MRTRLKTRYEAVQFLTERNNRLNELNANTTKIFPKPSIMGKKKCIKKDLYGPIVLHGSIYILSPIFIKDMEQVFYEKTFLYGEEEIFTLLSYAKGHKIIYIPEIKVLHKVKMSTDISDLHNYYKKSYSYIIDFANIYIELLYSMGL
jgi:GT2 family glycosyltransferase